MADGPSNSIVHVGIDGKAAEKLVEETARGISGLFAPRRIVKIARAEAEAAIIRTQAEAEAAIIRTEGEIKVRELEQRADYRLRAQALQEQQNLEEIAARTQPLLAEGATSDNVDDDWLANYRDKARLISNPEMQTLWARVIASEVNQPGTFSRRTVNAIADIDRLDCEAFTNLCRFCWFWLTTDQYVPLVFDDVNDPIYNDHGVNFVSLRHLDSIGLISFQGPGGSFSRNMEAPETVMYFGERFLLQVPEGQGRRFRVSRVMLTAIGRELAPIAGAESLPAFRDFMLSRWAQFLKPLAP